VLVLLFVGASSAMTLGRDKPENPYKKQPASRAQSKHNKQKVLFTTEKRKPSKAERRAVLEDHRIPKASWEDYIVEYRVPATLGGSNAYSNIEALPKLQARIKHQIQRELERQLRQQEISLIEAQQRILNWSQEASARERSAASSGTQSGKSP
jgi:hypothetical protein